MSPKNPVVTGRPVPSLLLTNEVLLPTKGSATHQFQGRQEQQWREALSFQFCREKLNDMYQHPDNFVIPASAISEVINWVETTIFYHC